MFYLVSLVTGLLFGIGMAFSGMMNPEKVIAFLNITGQWDPTLLFVMGGALAVFIPAYFLLVKDRPTPIASGNFCLNNSNTIDPRLIAGAMVFGLGWGLMGVCPGPVISSLLLGNSDSLIFFLSMIAGIYLFELTLNIRLRRQDNQLSPAISAD